MRTSDGSRYAFFDVSGPSLEPTAEGWRKRPLVVAVPSGPGFSRATLAPWLAGLETAAQVAAVDLPSAGLASRQADADYGFAAFVADLDAVRERLDREAMVVLGHGWGATLAVEYALAHPDRIQALVLVSPITGFTGEGQDVEAQVRQVERTDPTLIPRYMSDVLPRIQAAMSGAEDWSALERHPWWAEMSHTQFARPAPALWTQALRGEPWGMRAYAAYKGAAMTDPGHPMAAYDLTERLAGVVCPVLVLSSDNDANYVASHARHSSKISAARPETELVVWSDVGHFPFVERPEDFCALVTDFLKRRGIEPLPVPS